MRSFNVYKKIKMHSFEIVVKSIVSGDWFFIVESLQTKKMILILINSMQKTMLLIHSAFQNVNKIVVNIFLVSKNYF